MHNLSVYWRNNSVGILEVLSKKLEIAGLRRLIYKLSWCPPNIPRGIFRRYPDRKCGP